MQTISNVLNTQSGWATQQTHQIPSLEKKISYRSHTPLGLKQTHAGGRQNLQGPGAEGTLSRGYGRMHTRPRPR